MGWLTDRLERLIKELREQIEGLAPDVSQGNQEDFKRAIDGVSALERICNELIDPKGTTDTVYIRQFSSLNKCENFLRKQREAQRPSPLDFPLLYSIKSKIFELTNNTSYLWFYDLKADEAPDVASILITDLLSHLPLSNHPAVDIDIRYSDEFSPVLYHPRETPRLLAELVRRACQRWRSDDPPVIRPETDWGTNDILFLMPVAEHDHLALHISMWGWRMTPDRWHMMQPNHEHLHEFGGSIEPLTWDKGYGQGIIVRLPWANVDKRNERL